MVDGTDVEGGDPGVVFVYLHLCTFVFVYIDSMYSPLESCMSGPILRQLEVV